MNTSNRTQPPVNEWEERTIDNEESEKSLLSVYIRWLVGGLIAWHHLYLGRECHAAALLFILLHQAIPCGYIFLALLTDLLLLPEYVTAVNDAARRHYGPVHRANQEATPSPPYSLRRFLGQILMGFLFGSMFDWAATHYLQSRAHWLSWLVPCAVSLAIWLVGNIGRQKGCILHCLFGAYCAYFLVYFMLNVFYALIVIATISAMAFNWFSMKWRRRPVRHQTLSKHFRFLLILVLGLCVAASWVTLDNMSASPRPPSVLSHLKSNLKTRLHKIFGVFSQHGFFGTEEQKARAKLRKYYQALGLTDVATRAEITAAFRQLAKKYHPDRQQLTDKAKAHENWLPIREAYEILRNTLSAPSEDNPGYD
ncbi:dnaJ homolog subfamily C member 22-like [Drosophila subobscura]|uniref:dnaJ homolog subfamily C member 22-like n=1 Tax=Drosophila subobscura TaxID=7241 RepID=UPI00155A75C0|nr:dnaJ homolog subfamily C member 22-like [Drosophila subobscura]